ncbi:MAG: hypothetical protein ACJ8EP_05225 [Sphingomicrobium sp.]
MSHARARFRTSTKPATAAAMEESSEPARQQSDRIAQVLRWLSSSEILVTLPTLVISLALAYFSFVQADAARKMQRSGTWPYVSFDTGNISPEGKAEISFNLSNDGVGPARLEGMEFIYRGRPMSSPLQFLHECCGGDNKLALTTSGVGGVLRPGEKRTFISLAKNDVNAAIWNKLNNERWKVTLRTCYCSIFDDCWFFDNSKARPDAVEVCPAEWATFEERSEERTAAP